MYQQALRRNQAEINLIYECPTIYVRNSCWAASGQRLGRQWQLRQQAKRLGQHEHVEADHAKGEAEAAELARHRIVRAARGLEVGERARVDDD